VHSDEMEYKAITESFFEKDWQERFDVFYQVPIQGQRKYIKFGEYDPKNYSRLVQILREKDNEVFYIKETDLYKYYQYNVLKNLFLGLVKDRPPPQEVFRRVYPVACRIIQDYMDFPTTDSFLRLLDELPEVLVKAVEGGNILLQQIFAVTSRENTIHHHCINVGFYCLALARELEMNREDLRMICLGGMVADIGKKYIEREVMYKKGKLTEEDFRSIRRHPSIGRKALNDTKHYPDTVLRMAGEHHENFDGTGYPLGYSGARINRAARLCKLADVFNALTSRRTYGEVMTPLQALTLMKEKLASHFDPELLAIFIRYAGKR